jgi:hypothetical protein
MSITKYAMRTIYATALVLAGTLSVTQAVTVDLVAVTDASLRNNAPDMPSGDSNPLIVGVSKDPFTVTNRGVLKFDLSSIPTNATVIGASLRTTIYRSNTGPANYDLNRLLVDWSEYEVTWNHRNASTPWSVGGGLTGVDYVTAPSVTAPVDEGDFGSSGMVSDVQLWVRNAGTNYGWILMATGEALGTGKQLGSRESDFPPTLTVDYTLTPPTTQPALFDAAATENEFRFSFNAESNRDYVIEFRDALANGGWNSLTNISALPTNLIITVTNPISSVTRFYRARTP